MSASRLIPHFLRNTGLRERFALAMGVFVISTGLAVTLLMESRLSTGLRESAHQRLSYVARDLAKRIEEDLSERRLEISRLAIALSSSDGMSARPMQQVLDGLRARVPAYA